MSFSGVTTLVSLTEGINPGISLSVITNPNPIYVELLQQPLSVQSVAQAQSLCLDTRRSLRSSLVCTYTSFKHNLTAYSNNEPSSEFPPASTCDRKYPEILARLGVDGGYDVRIL